MEPQEKNKEFVPSLTVEPAEKEALLRQHAVVIWFTGLSGAGKTTLGVEVERELYSRGFLTQILDSDHVRLGLNRNLGYSVEDRNENIRRIAEVAKLFTLCGVVVINCFISPTNRMRQMAREIIGKEHFIEVFVDAPMEVCEARDVKGLYKKARRGEIHDFTGIDSPFEIPELPELVVDTQYHTVAESVREVLDYILPRISPGSALKRTNREIDKYA